MNFLTAVGQVLRISGIIRGDTDVPASFTDQQHAATTQLAMIAIQTTLSDVAGYHQFPQERVQGSITLLTGVPAYSLPADFVEMWNELPYFYDSVLNSEIFEFKGGEEYLARIDYKYRTTQGTPNWWYFADGVSALRQVGFYQVPSVDFNNRVLTFDYNKDVIPQIEADNMPFIRLIEAQMFCNLASVKFDALFSKQPKNPNQDIQKDPVYINARADLLRLIVGKKPPRAYGRRYSSGSR
jgi:hypothetical protein